MERIEGMSIGLNLETLQLQRGLTGLKDRMKTLNSEMKAHLSAFDRGDKSVEKYEATLQGLNRKMELQKRIVSESRAEYEKMIKDYGQGSKEAEATARAYNNQVASLNNLERAVNRTSLSLTELKQDQGALQNNWSKLGRVFDETGSKLTGLGSKMQGAGSALTSSLTLPIAGAGAGIMGLATKFNNSSVKIQNSLGTTAKETKKLTQISKNIYNDGFGESLEEVDTALLETKQNITDLNDKDLEKITKKAMTLANTFDADVNEVTRAGNTLITNYGMDADAAFDLMAKGAQNGMNFSKEMFDNMAEYTISFKEAGFSANEMFSILSNGAKKGYNLDRLNDTMLEFKLQAEDSSKSYVAAMGSMSKSTQEVYKEYENGNASVADLYKAVIPDLQKMKKELPAKEFNTIGKALFGTKWEDQGADVVLSMKTINKELQNNKGTMDKMTKNVEQSFGARLKGTLREAGTALLPFGNILLSVAEKILPKVSSGIQAVSSFISSLSPAVQTVGLIFAGLLAALGPVITMVGMFVAAIGNLLPVFTPVMGAIARAGGLLNVLRAGLAALTGPVGIVIGAITLLGAGFVALYRNSQTFRNGVSGVMSGIQKLGQSALNILKPAIESVKQFFQSQLSVIKKFWQDNSTTILQALSNIGSVVRVVFQGISAVIGFVMPFILSIIKSVWGNIQGVISGALNIIMGLVKVFSGLFTGNFSKMWEGLKQIFKGAVQFIWNFVQLQMFGKLLSLGKVFITSFRGAFVGLWNGLKSLFSSSAGAAKNAVVGSWNILKSVTTTIFNAYRSFLSGIWNFLKSMITKTASGIVSAVRGSWNLLKSVTTTIFNAYRSFLSGIWNFLKSMITKTASAIANAVRSAWNSLKSATTSIFNSVRGFLTSLWTGVQKTVSNLASKTKDGVVNAWSTLRNRTTEIFTNIKSKTSKIFDDIVSGAKKLPGRIGSGIKQMAGKVKDGVSAVGAKLAGGLETVLNNITQKGINVVLDKIGVSKKSQIPRLDIPGYATGTDSHPGGYFFAGDGGKNELIRFPDGRITMSPDSTTLYWGPKGTQVLSGEQTEQVMGAAPPMYKKGTGVKNPLKAVGEWTKEKGSQALSKGKDLAGKVADSIGDVWSYISNPKKLVDKIWKTLSIKMPNVGGIMGQIASSGVSKIKDGAVSFLQSKLSEYMPSDDGSSTGIGSYYLNSPFRITTRFTPNGNKNDRVHKGGKHNGLDLAAPAGTIIKSITDGIVREVLVNNPTGGNLVRIASGKDLLSYAHMLTAPPVKVGQKVKEGQKIGLVGSTGFSTGNHLDLKIKRNGKYIDPLAYLKGMSGSGPAGKGAKAWRSLIYKAAAQMNEKVTEREVNGIIAQIDRESKGNEKITQSSALRDINVRNGNPAKGLLQFVSSTFKNYAVKGHGNIWSGYDQLLAFFNNTTWRRDLPYGRRGWSPRGKRKYRMGTGLFGHIGGDAILGDGNKKEPFLLPDGTLGLSPSKATLFPNLPAGTVVWSSIQDFLKEYAGFAAPANNNRTDAMKLVALAGKEFQQNKSSNPLFTSTGNNTSTNQGQQQEQSIHVENHVSVSYAGLPNRDDVIKFAKWLQEIMDEQTEQQLRAKGVRWVVHGQSY
ncbi:peptidoglycan DD-metalloendopeptidase family protein [Priestia megaterium]|uniref:peptidoglycan DD-metalloendopeptidase family protein n=1 Tax=Priestia megaterium TaxID=1404 RepID=UPI0022824D70|nr:peptidoglycan DD-metalloendopeptidase family protein [Priestia megaterium]MCY9026381.1 peptidoglycan DD-metalloendopeptidase family protein [Priestia megaterium]